MQESLSRCPLRRKGQKRDKSMPMFGLSNFPSLEDLSKVGKVIFTGVKDAYGGFGQAVVINTFELETDTHIIPFTQRICDKENFTAGMAGKDSCYVAVQDYGRKVVVK